MQFSERTLGELHCRVVDTVADGETPRAVAVYCHGFGASGTDLVPVAAELCQQAPDLIGQIRFVFPEAPLSLDELGMPGARAWWHLDIAKLNAAIEQGEFRDLRNDLPAGLPEARNLLMGLVAAIQDEWKTPSQRLVLGGFSQGSMLVTDVALRLPEPPAALNIWSGTLLCEQEWTRLAGERGHLSVVQSHGHADPILPFAAAEWLRDLLSDAGLDVDFLEFSGVHTIPTEALVRTAVLLKAISNAAD